jgi:hypothetical protein
MKQEPNKKPNRAMLTIAHNLHQQLKVLAVQSNRPLIDVTDEAISYYLLEHDEQNEK